MDLTSGTMYDILRDHVWNDLGPLDPDWFETLSAEAFEEGDVLDKDELCANQEALRANQEETPVAKRRRYSPMSSTPRDFRLNRTLSPETDQESVSAQQAETPWKSRSPRASLEKSSSFDLFAHLLSPNRTGDRPGSPVQSQTSYARDISERLGAHVGDTSWSSSLITPPPVPSTWILTRKESESTITLSGDTSILARRLFHFNQSGLADGPIPEAAVVSEGQCNFDAEVTSLNSKTAPNSTCKVIESPLRGSGNATYTNRNSIFRKVRSERIHRRHITPTNETGCEDVEASKDKSSNSLAENSALSPWSPIDLSQVQSQNFSPSVCLSALKRTKLRVKRGLNTQYGENIGGQDPASTSKPSNVDDSGFSSATIPVSDLGNKATSEKENKDNFSDSAGFRTASNKNIKVSLASLKKAKNLFDKPDEKEIGRHALPEEYEASADKNCVSNNDWNRTVSRKADVREGFITQHSENIGGQDPTLTLESSSVDNGAFSSTNIPVSDFGSKDTSKKENTNTFSDSVGFRTASNKNIKVSLASLKKAKNLFPDEKENGQNNLPEEFEASADKNCVSNNDWNLAVSQKADVREGFISHNSENFGGQDPALTLKPSSVDNGAFSSTNIPVADFGSKATSKKENTNTFSDSVGFRTASNKNMKVLLASLKKVKNLFPDEKENDRNTLPDEFEASANKTGVSNNDWNLTVSRKAEVWEGFITQHEENIGGQDPALTLKPTSFGNSAFSSTNISVSDFGSKTTSEKENTNTFSDSVGFRTASNKNIKVSLESLKKVKNLFPDEKENDRNTLHYEFQTRTNKNGVSNNDWNLTVSQKAEVKELCEFLEQSDSPFDFTQATVQNRGCPTLKSEALTFYSPAKIPALNQPNKAEKRPVFGEASETTLKMKGQNSRNNFEVRNVNASFTQGFKMASGKGITVSDQNLQKSQEFFQDLVHDIDCFGNANSLGRNETHPSVPSHFSESCSDKHSVSAIQKGKMRKAENYVKPDHSKVLLNAQKSHFVAACRKPLVVTAQAKSFSVDANESLKDTTSSERPKHHQKSDAEEEICPKPKGIDQPIVKSGQSNEDPAKISGFSTNNAVKLTSKVSYESDKPGESGITNAEALQSSFRTARGAQVQVSKKHVEKVKHLWKDFDCLNSSNELIRDMNENSKCHNASIDGTCVGENKRKTHNAVVKLEVHTDPQTPQPAAAVSRSSAFQTAAGAKVNVSSESLSRTKQMWSECEDGQSKAPGLRGSESVVPTNGFLTGSGKKLSVSADAMLKAKALFDDIGSTSDTSKIIKTSIAEKLESLSSHKHSNAHTRQTTFPKLDSREYCGSKNGFTTASGKTVRVSEEALNKAMGLLSEGAELGNGLQDNALRKASMSNKSAKPQFPKSNSENKSLSPHLTSSDGPCLRRETKAEMRFSTTTYSDAQTKNEKEGAFLPLELSVSRLDSIPAPNMEENSGCGFTTASGKKVRLSEEALKKAMKMLSNEMELNGDDRSCTDEVMTEEMNASKSQFRSVQSKCDSAAMDITSKKETRPQENAPSVVVNLDMLHLGGCTSTQQQFLAQEALDCTRALLEDEVRAANSLTVGLERNSVLTSSSGQPQNNMEKREGQTGEPLLKRPSPEEPERDCDVPKKPVPNPAWSCFGGLLKDRRVFQYHVSRHPNTPRPHGCIKEHSNPTPALPTVTRKGATFVPPFLSTKAKAPRDELQNEKEKTCTFVPPFKKHKSDIRGNVTLNKDGDKESSTIHTFVPPAPKRPNPPNDSTGKRGGVPDHGQVFTPEHEADKEVQEEEIAPVVRSPEMEQDVKSTTDASTHETLGSMGDLARDLQDMRIRKKTRQTIKPLPGSLFLTKSSPLKRLSFRAAVNGESPHKYSPKQLYQFGVDQRVCHVTSQTAESFRFDLLKFHKRQFFLESGAVQLADGGWLVPRRDGTVGKEEFYKALCDTPGVDPRLISPQWAYNHYRWIVWKLASTERAFPLHLGSVCFTPEQVLLQLKYRYDVEVDHSRRSSLRKIMEKDDTSAKTMVLCVCGIFSDGQASSGPAQEASVKPESSYAVVWLTDGWYSIKAQLDPPLTSMLHRGHIKEGVKLMVHGAQLSGSEEACTPLEAPHSLLLKICANSTRRVRWDTRLGFYKDPRPFAVPLSSLFSKGGAVGSVDMLILRIYPIQWMERTTDGGVVFRSARAEEKEARRYNNHKHKHLEALYSKINAQFEKEDREGLQSKKRRRTVSREGLGSVVDGEELYEAVGDELSDVEALLSAEQLHSLCEYKRSVLERRQAELQDRLRRAVEEAEASEGSCPCRDVSPVWRLCIRDYLDQSSSTVYRLSVWSPSAELQALLKEGCRYHAYNLTASEGRSGAGRATVQLTATRKTLFTRLQTSSHWLLAHFWPRASVSFKALQNPDFLPLCGEVDLTGCVIRITDQHGSSPVMYLVDEGLQVVKVRACGSLARCGWEDVVEPRALVSLSNLQVRGQCVSDPPVLYAGDMTELSTNPRESHLQQSLGRLRHALQAQDDFFLRAEQTLVKILTPQGQRFSATEPTTPRSTRTTAQDRRTPNSTKVTTHGVENRPATTPAFKTPARANPSAKKDPQSLRRRRVLEHLSQYPPPPPLPPLNTTASPSVNKTFCPPRRSPAPATPAGSAGPAPVEEGWVRDEELALIDTQELRADGSLMA